MQTNRHMRRSVYVECARLVQAFNDAGELAKRSFLELCSRIAPDALSGPELDDVIQRMERILPTDSTDGDGHGLRLLESEGFEDVVVLATPDDHGRNPFAERVRAAMEARGLTQAQLAEAIGVGQPAVSMMLKRACRPQQRTIDRMADALGVDAEVLWPTEPG